MTESQVMFWEIVALIIIVPLAIAGICYCTKWTRRLGRYILTIYVREAAMLWADNNTRALYLFIFAGLLFVSAIIGGRGKPLLTDQVAKAKARLEKIQTGAHSDEWSNLLSYDIPVVRTTKQVAPVVSATPHPSKKDEPPPPASWRNWTVAFIALIAAVVYLPISRFDEFMTIARRILQRRRERRTAHGGDSDGQAPAPTEGQAQVPTKRENSIWRELSFAAIAEIISEFFQETVRKTSSRITRTT